jgi:hypothetical protein
LLYRERAARFETPLYVFVPNIDITDLHIMAFDISPAVLAYVPPDPPLKEFEPPKDRAFFADPKKASLLASASSVEEVTPHIGTELKGVQVSQLTDAQKDELALLVAEVCLLKHVSGLNAYYFTERGSVL